MEYIFAYGSLLSEYSRRHYSGIEAQVLPVTLTGWYRAWCTSYPDEGASYAGALRVDTVASKSTHFHELDGVLIPSVLDEDLQQRERGYQFTRLDADSLRLDNSQLSDEDRVWICETIKEAQPSIQTPLPQSYVDTCLLGCIESQGMDAASRFIKQTSGWDCVWINDRIVEHGSNKRPIYPRYTPINDNQSELIDQLLEFNGVLKYRQSYPMSDESQC